MSGNDTLKKKKDALREKAKFYGIVRFIILAVLVIGQISLLILIARLLSDYSAYIYTLFQISAIVIVIGLVGNESSPAYRISWIVTVAVLPGFGLFLYLAWGRGSARKKMRKWTEAGNFKLSGEEKDARAVTDKICALYPHAANITERLFREDYFAYENTEFEYYPVGEDMFEALISALSGAKEFIFLEYFIVSDGEIWRRIFDVIKRKAAEGVEVRLSYDDFGSIITIPKKIKKNLLDAGIQVINFNPIYKKVHRLFVNYRNHQKIAVIDGNTAFTGGVNIGDEYANIFVRHGHWKDTAVMLKGDGAWGLTKIFLEMWELAGGKAPDNMSVYKPSKPSKSEGYCQPFADGPNNDPRNPIEDIYKQIIYNARKYVYITSPYLIIGDDMLNALRTAARSNVDVRIMLPAIHDHWYTRALANSYYGTLISAGVKIYEYTPGFLHAKSVLSDDYSAIVGSMNMDLRSFNLNFECGVWFCGAYSLNSKLKNDMLAIIEKSVEIDLSKWRKRPFILKIIQKFLRLVSPLV